MASSIINSDDGVVSGTSGLKTTGGDDGVLVFQSKGTETARINTDKQIVAAAGTASLPALTTTGDVNTGIFFPAADTIAFAEGGAEAMRIDSSGRMLIGQTSGNYPLEVTGGNGNGIKFTESSNNVQCIMAGFNSTALFGTITNHPMLFWVNNGERARITSAGLFQFNSGYGSVATAYGCRAWVSFNGTGTVAIRGSGNVSSITDNGTGNYTVNFTTAMPDANYAISAFTNHGANTVPAGLATYGSDYAPAVGSVSVKTVTSASYALMDPQYVNVSVFR